MFLSCGSLLIHSSHIYLTSIWHFKLSKYQTDIIFDPPSQILLFIRLFILKNYVNNVPAAQARNSKVINVYWIQWLCRQVSLHHVGNIFIVFVFYCYHIVQAFMVIHLLVLPRRARLVCLQCLSIHIFSLLQKSSYYF